MSFIISEYLIFAKFATKLNTHQDESQEKLLREPRVNDFGTSFCTVFSIMGQLSI
jgi:hypothetical protein